MDSLELRASQQWGRQRLEFDVPGARGFIILPSASGPAGGKKPIPWLWYSPCFFKDPYPLPKDLHEWYMGRWLDAGIAIGGADVGEAWGSPAGRSGFSEFYTAAVAEFNLDPQCCMLGQSRGGVFVYNWAVEHPELVRCILGIYPLCDLIAFAERDTVRKAYGMTADELRARSAEHNPIERLEPLARQRVPIVHIHGDADERVPLEGHSRKLLNRYEALGGPCELIVVHGKGHKEIPEFFQCPAVAEFILSHAIRRGGRADG